MRNIEVHGDIPVWARIQLSCATAQFENRESKIHFHPYIKVYLLSHMIVLRYVMVLSFAMHVSCNICDLIYQIKHLKIM